MKKIIFYIALLAFSTGCKKFLDVEPKGKTIPTGFEQFNGLLNNSLLGGLQNLKITGTSDAASGNLSYSFSLLGDVEAPFYMSDDIEANPATFQNYSQIEQNLYKWADDVYLPDDNSSEWNAMYIQNYVYNLIVNGVMNVTDATEEQKKQVWGEAKVARAYMHFLSAQLFSKPYNAATAATDPGIPIVTIASTSQNNFKRASVQETYDFIIGEINEALPGLSDVTINRNRISRLAAYSILGEVYFNMKKYDEALMALKQAFALVDKSNIPISLYDYNIKINDWFFSFLPNLGLFNHPNPFDSYESIWVKQTTTAVSSAFSSLTVLTPEVWALFGDDDLRKNIYSNKGLLSSSLILPGYQRAGPLTVNMGPTLSNLYLMKAECEARANQLDDAEADLVMLRENRMPAGSAAVVYAGQDELVQLILNERLREFAATGRRWFDMRRLFDDPKYNNVVGTRTVDGQNYTLGANRLELRIPPMILNYNPGMQNNP